MDVPENVKIRRMRFMKRTKKISPLNSKRFDRDRTADYPQLCSPESNLSHSPRCLSLSAISESSFTSNGSSVVLHDARKMPKKILKNPLHLKKHSNNHVRWNLAGGCAYESDTSSMLSFESTSTSSKEYGRTDLSDMSSTLKRVQPLSGPQGNMGPSLGNHLHRHCHHPDISHYQVPRSFTQSASCIRSISSSGTSLPADCPPHSLPGDSPVPATASTTVVRDAPRVCCRSISPLATSAITWPNRSPVSNFRNRRSLQSGSRSQDNINVCFSDSSVSDIDVPILMLNGNHPAPKESTMEGKKKVHISVFQFPQPSSMAQKSQAGNSVKYHPKMMRSYTAPSGIFFDDDDENDYDHLIPMMKDKSTVSTLTESKEKMDERKDKDSLGSVPMPSQTEKFDTDVYMDEDIEDALALIASESGDDHIQATSPSSEPSPIPPKMWTKSLEEDKGSRAACGMHKEVASTEYKLNELSLPWKEYSIIPNSCEQSIKKLEPNLHAKSNEERKAPPPSPKPVWSRRQARNKHGKSLRNGMPLSHSISQSTEELNSSSELSDIPTLPINSGNFLDALELDIILPPPQFSDMGFNSGSNSDIHRIGSLSTGDGLASMSNSKLAPNPDQRQEGRKDFSETENLCKDVAAFSLVPSSGRHHLKSQTNSSRVLHACKMGGDQVAAMTDRALVSNGRHVADARSSGHITTERALSRDQRPSVLDSCSDLSNDEDGEEMTSELSVPRKSGTEMSRMKGRVSGHLTPSSLPPTLPSNEVAAHANWSHNKRVNRSNGRGQSLAICRLPNHQTPPLPFTQGQKMRNELTVDECCPTNGKLPMIKPTIRDTERHTPEMLAGINIEDTRSRRANSTAFGKAL